MKIICYTKHFRKELSATKCRMQPQCEKWHYGHDDHNSIDHLIAGITNDLVISPEQFRSLAKGKMNYPSGQFLEVEYDTKNLSSSQTVPRVPLTGLILTEVLG